MSRTWTSTECDHRIVPLCRALDNVVHMCQLQHDLVCPEPMLFSLNVDALQPAGSEARLHFAAKLNSMLLGHAYACSFEIESCGLKCIIH